jgi:hypothetical protein
MNEITLRSRAASLSLFVAVVASIGAPACDHGSDALDFDPSNRPDARAPLDGGASGEEGGGTPAKTYVLTVVGGTGGGSYAAGATAHVSANLPPAGQEFLGWTGAAVANAASAVTTLTMTAADATVTANFGMLSTSTIPCPVSTHPRLWVTQADLPRLRSWATASNQVYQQGMVPVLANALNAYLTQFFPNGAANSNYPDPGDPQGYAGTLTEEVGVILAFNSLVDPDPNQRIKYAQYVRNLLMYAATRAAMGPQAGAPFRDPEFMTYNRGSAEGAQWALMVDWIYDAVDGGGQPILSAGDKRTIRDAFMVWEKACETASTTGGDSPQLPGVINDPKLLPGNLPYRMAANNYYAAHARNMTMWALAVDPSDDPPVSSAMSGAVLGNSLRSYLTDAVGAWLYQQYAMYGEPAAVASGYGISQDGAGFGLASGGLPPEGMLYGESYGYVLGELLALQTAGFDGPALASYTGPQIALTSSPVWDRFVTGILSSLTPAGFVPPTESYLGSIYQFAAYGDMLRFWVTPDYVGPFALLSALEEERGQSTHVAAARWFVYNVLEGGPSKFFSRITQGSYGQTQTILHYMLFDPSVAYDAPADPRSGYSNRFVDPTCFRAVAHTDWSTSGTMFDYRACWESINHQDGTAGQFEMFRKGEWLTKEMSNYDNNELGWTTYYHNTLALQNTSPSGSPTVNSWEQNFLADGSQWLIGQSAGDPSTVSSSGANYFYAASDLTNLYDRPDMYTPSNSVDDVVQATRSILWLDGDYVVVYDRATTKSPGLFKRWNLTLVANPVIQGNVATETLPSGQQLFLQSLLPAQASMAAREADGDLAPIAELEPTKYVVTVQDPSNPVDVRFLHVIQGADAGASMTAATHVKSGGGVAFDGAVFGRAAVYFPVAAGPAMPTGTTFPAPAGVHEVFVTGLAPKASFGVSTQSSGGAVTVTVAPGASTTSDGGGVLVVSL